MRPRLALALAMLLLGSGCTVAFPLGVYADSHLGREAKPISVGAVAATEPGHRLRVARSDCPDIYGTLIQAEPAAEPTSVVLRVRGDEVPVPLSNVTSVERYDPPPNLWPAVAIGAAVDIVLLVFGVEDSVWSLLLSPYF